MSRSRGSNCIYPVSRITDVWHHTQLLCGCWGCGLRLSCLLMEACPQPGSCFLCRLESCVLVSVLCLWRSIAFYHSVYTGRDREIEMRVCIGMWCSYETACFRVLVLEGCSRKPEPDWEMIFINLNMIVTSAHQLFPTFFSSKIFISPSYSMLTENWGIFGLSVQIKVYFK